MKVELKYASSLCPLCPLWFNVKIFLNHKGHIGASPSRSRSVPEGLRVERKGKKKISNFRPVFTHQDAG